MTYALFNRLEDLVGDYRFSLAVLEERPGFSRPLLCTEAGAPLGLLAKTESRFWFKSWFTGESYSFGSWDEMMLWITVRLLKANA